MESSRDVIKNDIEKLKNITLELNQKDNELIRSEKKFKSFFNINEVPMAILSQNGYFFVDINKTFSDILGFSKEELESKTIFDIVSEAINQDGVDNWQLNGALTKHIHQKSGEQVLILWRTTSKSEDDFIYAIANDVTIAMENKKKLQEREKLYRILTEESYEVICLHDRDGIFKYVSPSVYMILGYTQEELHGKKLYDLISPEDRAAVINKSNENINIGNSYGSIKYRIRHKNGKWKWFHTIIRPIFDEKGEFLEMHSSSRDITKEVNLEEEMKEAKDMYQMLVDNTTDLVKLFNSKGEILYISKSCEDITGYTAEEHMLHEPFKIIPKEDVPMMMETFNKVLTEKKKHNVIHRGITKNGETVFVETFVIPIIEKGQIKMVMTIGREITKYYDEIKSMEYEKNKFDTLVDKSDELIMLHDEDGIIKFINSKIEDKCGWKREDIIGKKAFDFIHSDHIERIEKIFKESINKKKVFKEEVLFLTKNKSYQWFETFITPFGSDDNLGIITYSKNIQKRKEKENKLKKGYEMMNEALDMLGVCRFDMDIKTKKCFNISSTTFDILNIDKTENPWEKIENENINKNLLLIAKNKEKISYLHDKLLIRIFSSKTQKNCNTATIIIQKTNV